MLRYVVLLTKFMESVVKATELASDDDFDESVTMLELYHNDFVNQNFKNMQAVHDWLDAYAKAIMRCNRIIVDEHTRRQVIFEEE